MRGRTGQSRPARAILALALWALLLVGCGRQATPPGSTAVARTPTGVAQIASPTPTPTATPTPVPSRLCSPCERCR